MSMGACTKIASYNFLRLVKNCEAFSQNSTQGHKDVLADTKTNGAAILAEQTNRVAESYQELLARRNARLLSNLLARR